MQFKLAKAYMNCFIIDEDDECEVMEIIKIKPSEMKFSENRFIRKCQDLYYHSELIKFSDLWESTHELFNRFYHLRSIQIQNYQMHCIYSVSLDFDLFFCIISIIFAAHSSILLILRENHLTEKEFRSIPRSEFRELQFDETNETIGDNIDFFIDKFEAFNSSLSILEYIFHETLISFKFHNPLERKKVFSQAFDYLGILNESEQSYRKIECHRKFIPRQDHFIRSFLLTFVLLNTICIGLRDFPTWYRRISEKILYVVISYLSQNNLVNFCLCFMTSLSILFVHWKCFFYL